MTHEDLPKSDPGAAAAGQTTGTKGVAAVKGWIQAMKPPPSATAHKKWHSSDGGGSVDQQQQDHQPQQRCSNTGSSVNGTQHNNNNNNSNGANGTLWSPEVASAMGYGKK